MLFLCVFVCQAVKLSIPENSLRKERERIECLYRRAADRCEKRRNICGDLILRWEFRGKFNFLSCSAWLTFSKANQKELSESSTGSYSNPDKTIKISHLSENVTYLSGYTSFGIVFISRSIWHWMNSSSFARSFSGSGFKISYMKSSQCDRCCMHTYCVLVLFSSFWLMLFGSAWLHTLRHTKNKPRREKKRKPSQQKKVFYRIVRRVISCGKFLFLCHPFIWSLRRCCQQLFFCFISQVFQGFWLVEWIFLEREKIWDHWENMWIRKFKIFFVMGGDFCYPNLC